MRLFHLATLPSVLLAASLAGCETDDVEIQPTSEAAQLQCNNEYNRANGIAGCWVEFYSEDEFTGHCVRVYGPIEIANMDFEAFEELDGDIESVRVGPLARLEVFDDAEFGDDRQEFTSNMSISDLSDLFIGDDVESLRIRVETRR